jgi:hypothetical protein
MERSNIRIDGDQSAQLVAGCVEPEHTAGESAIRLHLPRDRELRAHYSCNVAQDCEDSSRVRSTGPQPLDCYHGAESWECVPPQALGSLSAP